MAFFTPLQVQAHELMEKAPHLRESILDVDIHHGSPRFNHGLKKADEKFHPGRSLEERRN